MAHRKRMNKHRCGSMNPEQKGCLENKPRAYGNTNPYSYYLTFFKKPKFFS
ncbi:hypothetical protein LEP1GSC047_1391 [Leptospira inadai serovar Lyme str. 10]|uniref:Uncharacterized protein n=1 Tax=Leptospira inadai serovar Lyme str. 10 TaxID=1049790 RepID=V6H948_9LEPT|nr:hypothetical protein LEP1GSC047_1391 [Leptospira inadai serovar Lyme str. 10]